MEVCHARSAVIKSWLIPSSLRRSFMLGNCNASPEKLSIAQDVLQQLQKSSKKTGMTVYLAAIASLVGNIKLLEWAGFIGDGAAVADRFSLPSLSDGFKQFLQTAAASLGKAAQSDNEELATSLMAANTAQLLQDWLQAGSTASIDLSAVLEKKLSLLLGQASAESRAVIAWLELASRNASSASYGFAKFAVASLLLRPRLTGRDAEARFESIVSRASQNADEQEYAEALGLLDGALQTERAEELASALHLASVLICRPPERESL